MLKKIPNAETEDICSKSETMSQVGEGMLFEQVTRSRELKHEKEPAMKRVRGQHSRQKK